MYCSIGKHVAFFLAIFLAPTFTLVADTKVIKPYSIGVPVLSNPHNKMGLLEVTFVHPINPSITATSNCSAQFVGSKNTLLTAAHCLHYKEERKKAKPLVWKYKSARFAPHHNKDSKSNHFNVEVTDCVILDEKWKNDSRSYEVDKYDYAFLQTKQESRYEFMNIKTGCLLYTSPSPRDRTRSRMPSSA